jgi:hypothetical protein
MDRDPLPKDYLWDVTAQLRATGFGTVGDSPDGLVRGDPLYKRFRVPMEWRIKDCGAGG